MCIVFDYTVIVYHLCFMDLDDLGYQHVPTAQQNPRS